MKHPERIEDISNTLRNPWTASLSIFKRMITPRPWNAIIKTQAAVIRYVEMRAMRNRMIHNYFDVNIDVLWGAVKDDLPKLKKQIDRLLIDMKRPGPSGRD